MKCSTAALFAGLAAVATANTNSSSMAVEMTTSTVFSTQLITVTSCPPTVTSCPASATMVVTSMVAVSTTVCPVSASSAPAAAAAAPSSASAKAAGSSTVVVSSCPSSASSSAAAMITRSGVASPTILSNPKFTSIPVNGTMASATGPSMPVFTGAATKVGGSVGGLVVLLAAAFAL